jgi:hypothetical protein
VSEGRLVSAHPGRHYRRATLVKQPARGVVNRFSL